MNRTDFELKFDRFIREFADRFFRVIAWTVYLSVMMTIYHKTRNTMIWILCFVGFLTMFLFIQSYVRELGRIILTHYRLGEKQFVLLALIILSGLITLGLVGLSNTVALAIVQYGK
jgi:preprotein translocase subunit Sss1